MCVVFFEGAQSDSEVNSVHTGASDTVSDKGYTSDGELYETPSRTSLRTSEDVDLKAVPSTGSWLLVSVIIMKRKQLIRELAVIYPIIYIYIYIYIYVTGPDLFALSRAPVPV